MEVNLEYEFCKAQLDETKAALDVCKQQLWKETISQEIQSEIQGNVVHVEEYNKLAEQLELKNAEIKKLTASRDRVEKDNDNMRE